MCGKSGQPRLVSEYIPREEPATPSPESGEPDILDDAEKPNGRHRGLNPETGRSKVCRPTNARKAGRNGVPDVLQGDPEQRHEL